MEAMRALALAGLSVTMPHKTAAALHHLDVAPWAICPRRPGGCGPSTAWWPTATGRGGPQHRRPRFRGLAGLGCRLLGLRTALRGAGGRWCARGPSSCVWPRRCGRGRGAYNGTASKAAGAAALARPAGRVGQPADLADAELVVNATSVGMDGRSLPVEARGGRPPGSWWPTSSCRRSTPRCCRPPGRRGRPPSTGWACWFARRESCSSCGPASRRRSRSWSALLTGSRFAKGPLFRCPGCRWRGVHPLSEVIVALQGTLETFALPDVLRLLASTHKTGRLCLTGVDGSGSLWLEVGRS